MLEIEVCMFADRKLLYLKFEFPLIQYIKFNDYLLKNKKLLLDHFQANKFIVISIL